MDVCYDVLVPASWLHFSSAADRIGACIHVDCLPHRSKFLDRCTACYVSKCLNFKCILTLTIKTIVLTYIPNL